MQSFPPVLQWCREWVEAPNSRNLVCLLTKLITHLFSSFLLFHGLQTVEIGRHTTSSKLFAAFVRIRTATVLIRPLILGGLS
jgi:hypothetical protein